MARTVAIGIQEASGHVSGHQSVLCQCEGNKLSEHERQNLSTSYESLCEICFPEGKRCTDRRRRERLILTGPIPALTVWSEN